MPIRLFTKSHFVQFELCKWTTLQLCSSFFGFLYMPTTLLCNETPKFVKIIIVFDDDAWSTFCEVHLFPNEQGQGTTCYFGHIISRSLCKTIHRNRPDKKHYSGSSPPPIVVKQFRRIACDQSIDYQSTLFSLILLYCNVSIFKRSVEHILKRPRRNAD